MMMKETLVRMKRVLRLPAASTTRDLDNLDL